MQHAEKEFFIRQSDMRPCADSGQLCMHGRKHAGGFANQQHAPQAPYTEQKHTSLKIKLHHSMAKNAFIVFPD